MKKFKVLSVPGLIAVTCLSLFAQEPQGRGGQVAPAPDGAAGVVTSHCRLEFVDLFG
jgi:hypothetical protein